MTNNTSPLGIEGVLIGHDTDVANGTGCTVIICPQGATGAVDVRGGAPATRETDLLRVDKTVGVVHAVVLSGGSAYGLAASSGTMEVLEEHGIGLEVGSVKVPIVCSACLFDLFVGSSLVRPDALSGRKATLAALKSERLRDLEGNVGAGTGASVGKLSGIERGTKAGIGIATVTLGKLTVTAVCACNAVGDIIDSSNGKIIAGLRENESSSTLMSSIKALEDLALAQGDMPLDRTNTTISCIVTNANLDKAQAYRVAVMAHDAYATSIKPTHTSNDGDAVFCLATGDVNALPDVVGMLAIQALDQAIVRSATTAVSAYGLPSANDLVN